MIATVISSAPTLFPFDLANSISAGILAGLIITIAFVATLFILGLILLIVKFIKRLVS